MSQNPFQHLFEEEVTLPVTKFTVRYRKPTTEEGFELSRREKTQQDEDAKLEKNIEFILSLLVSWNAKDRDSNDVPLTRENLGFLPADDFKALTGAINGNPVDDPKAAA